MTDLYPSIKYEVTKSLELDDPYPDESQWLIEISAQIFVDLEYEGIVQVGRCKFYYVDADGAMERSNCGPWRLLDVDSSTEHFSVIYNDDTCRFTSVVEETLDDSFMSNNLFVIDRVEVISEYRGNGLARMAIEDAISLFAGGAEVIALKAYPLQFEAGRHRYDDKEWSEKVALDDLTTDRGLAQQKIIDLYTSMGFRAVVGSEGVLIRSRYNGTHSA
jgi:GNAT superfamily N-acetyltransferase